MFDEKCVYFWPVGTGESTTFVVRSYEVVFQVDLRHSQKSENEETDCAPVIDYLEEHLPKVDGKPSGLRQTCFYLIDWFSISMYFFVMSGGRYRIFHGFIRLKRIRSGLEH